MRGSYCDLMESLSSDEDIDTRETSSENCHLIQGRLNATEFIKRKVDMEVK